MGNVFFEESLLQSEIKTKIFTDYFEAWSKIMLSKTRSDRIAYIDLFCGPGKYSNGVISTPLIILEKVLSNPGLINKMVVLLNDANKEYVENLIEEIQNVPGIQKMKYRPKIKNNIVSDELAEHLQQVDLVPTLSFVDPWGYKGLTSKLISALIKDWGSDCIFFFNYNRINMGLTNPKVKEHMNSIFGAERADKLRELINGKDSGYREELIINELAEALSQERNNYVLPFRFMSENCERTSHYLVFVTKHVLGYTIMKEIMYKNSTSHEDGVASFSYIPVSNNQLSLLSLFDRPLDSLGDELCKKFSGKTLTVKEIHDRHHINTPFVINNYKEALRRLEVEKRILCNPKKRRTRKGVITMADSVKIKFL